MTGGISLLVGHTNVGHGRINRTVPERTLHFRQIDIATNHVCREGVFQNMRMTFMVGQAGIASDLSRSFVTVACSWCAMYLFLNW